MVDVILCNIVFYPSTLAITSLEIDVALTQDQFNKLIDLLRSKQQAFVQQGMLLTESVIYEESDFFALFRGLTTYPVPQAPSFQTIRQIFQQAHIDEGRLCDHITETLSCWSLGMLAQWNPNIVENTLSLDLSDSQIQMLPSSLQHLTRLQSLNLRRNHLKQLPQWLGDLTELRELNVSKNPLHSLPTNLHTLHIDDKQWHDLQRQFGH